MILFCTWLFLISEDAVRAKDLRHSSLLFSFEEGELSASVAKV